MNRTRNSIILLIAIVLLVIPGAAGCSSGQASTNKQVEAINQIRGILELPLQPLKFVEMTGMVNSPSGNLAVAEYQDSDGRKYFVNPDLNQVVEIDARVILNKHSSDTAGLAPDQLKAKAMKYIRGSLPGFDSLQSSWQFDEGTKGNNYFYSWYAEMTPGSMNRPFAQIGLFKTGELFAYYNTLLLNNIRTREKISLRDFQPLS